MSETSEVWFGEENVLTAEDIDLLLSDCDQELQILKNQQMLMVIELDSLKRKMRRIKNEKEYLDILKSGSTMSAELVNLKPQIKGTLTLRYQKILNGMRRLSHTKN